MKSHLDKMDVLSDETRRMARRLAGLEHDARQPRLAMEADVPADKKARERPEGAATAVKVKYGDSCSTNRVDPRPMYLTNFGDDSTGTPALPTAPTSCLSSLEMRSPTAAGSLLPAGKISTATRTTLCQLPLWFCWTEETNLRTSILYASYYRSCFWGIINQQAFFWPRVVETKSGQNLVFDHGGSTGRLRVCPFLGTWRALLCEEVVVRALDKAAAIFWRMDDSGVINLQEWYRQIIYAVLIAVDRCFSAAKLV